MIRRTLRRAGKRLHVDQLADPGGSRRLLDPPPERAVGDQVEDRVDPGIRGVGLA